MGALIKRLLFTLGAGAYALSPIDLIPDLIPVLGLADDAAVVAMLVYYWLTYLRDQERARQEQREPPPGEGPIIDVKPID